MNNSANRKISGLLSAVALIVSGCILSGTFAITFYLEFPRNFSGSSFQAASVDLTTEEDWDDHKDKIESIESVKMDGVVANNQQAADTFDVYISNILYASVAEFLATPAADKAPLLLGVPLPGGVPTTFDAGETAAYLQLSEANFDKIEKIVLDGNFHVYLIGKSPTFDITLLKGTIFVTFTASN